MESEQDSFDSPQAKNHEYQTQIRFTKQGRDFISRNSK